MLIGAALGPQHSAAAEPLIAVASSRGDAPALQSYRTPWTSPFHVDPAHPHHFVNREGHRLFILNKTAWAYFGQKHPREFLERARAQGINVIRVALEGRPYFPDLGIELWPWGGTRAQPDWNRMNPEYWAEVERRVALAGEHGIGLNVVLYFTIKPKDEDVERHRVYWNEALRRLGRHANVFLWEVANEYTGGPAFQEACGTFFKQNDHWRRPVATSDGTTDDAVWPDKPWIDVAIVHTCTSSEPRHDLRDWYQAVARNTRAHGKPGFNNESGREVRHRNDDAVHRRKQGWLWCMEGAYWTFHTREGCEAIDDPHYRGPGGEFLAPMVRFFENIPFWRMQPNHTALTIPDHTLVAGALAAPDRAIVVGYVCAKSTGTVIRGASANLRLPNGTYMITLVRPSDGAALGERQHESRGLGNVAVVPLPEFSDDLAIRIDRLRSQARTLIEGTR